MRSIALSATLLLFAASSGASAQAAHGKTHMPTEGRKSDAALIASALSAAPKSVTAGATIVDHDGRVLRKGTTDWVCMPDLPDVPNDTPMCLDAPWRETIDAWQKKRMPTVTKVGFGYMLQGDMPVSNVDPYATVGTATNSWIQSGDPHVMLLIPDLKLLDGLSTDPKSGGPFVMWKGTPYAHIMVPAPRVQKP